MCRRLCRKILLLLLVLGAALPVHAEYASWQDPDYDFKKVGTIYLSDMDFSQAVQLGGARQQNMFDYYRKKAGKVKKIRMLFPPATKERALLPGEKTVVAAPVQHNPVRIPEAAAAQKADLYVTAVMEKLDGGSYLVPAHTEWRTTELEDGYYDRDGKYHSWYRTVTYPEYVPAQYVPYVTVGVSFKVFDTATGALVLSSSDFRTRSGAGDPVPIYKRIVDRFFKNLKHTLRK